MGCSRSGGLPAAYVALATNSSLVGALVIPDIQKMNIAEETVIVKMRLLLLLTEVTITTGMNRRRTRMQATKTWLIRRRKDPAGI